MGSAQLLVPYVLDSPILELIFFLLFFHFFHFSFFPQHYISLTKAPYSHQRTLISLFLSFPTLARMFAEDAYSTPFALHWLRVSSRPEAELHNYSKPPYSTSVNAVGVNSLPSFGLSISFIVVRAAAPTVLWQC